MQQRKIDKDYRMTDDSKPAGQHKRKHLRVLIPGFVGDLADGWKIIGGNVENISPGGFEMSNLPQSFTAQNHFYTTVLSGGGKHYKVLAKPCWRKKKGENHLAIGFKILDAPWQWLELTLMDS